MPDLVLSSDSERTRQTLAHMWPVPRAERNKSGHQPTTIFLPGFYHAGPRGVIHAVSAMTARDEICATKSAAASTVMLLGHNPGWESLLARLCGENITMPTAAAALVTRQAPGHGQQWHDRHSWQLQDVLIPRLIMNSEGFA